MQNDKEIEVPDFETNQNFSDWVENLSDKEIQSWRAKDWNKMYDKLFQFIGNSPEIEAQASEALEAGQYYTWEDGTFLTINDLSKEQLIKVKRKIFCEKFKNIEDPISQAMSKLYANYRMEPKQKEIVQKLAEEAGKKVASTREIHTADISTSDHSRNLYNATEVIERIVYEQTSYPEALEKLGYDKEKLRAKLETKKSSYRSGGASKTEGVPAIEVGENNKYADVPLDTIFHEAAHAHLQIFKYELIEELKKIKPVKDFDEDFINLLTNNQILYFSQKEKESENFALAAILVAGLTGKLSDKDFKELSKSIETKNYKKSQQILGKVAGIINKTDRVKFYKNQPLEYFAQLYGLIAARSFRRASGQYSERGIEDTINHLKQIDSKMELDISNDENGNIVFDTHSISNHKSQYLKYLFTGKDNPMNGKVEIRDNDTCQIVLLSSGYSIQKAWQEWDEKIWKPIQAKIETFAKEFTSKNEFSITMDSNGRAKIEFTKHFPYSADELFGKIYNIDTNKPNSLKTRIALLTKKIGNDEMYVSDENIVTPPVNSKEFDRLLNLFEKDKIGFIEAEQKRDALKRYRRRKIKKIAKKLGFGAYIH